MQPGGISVLITAVARRFHEWLEFFDLLSDLVSEGPCFIEWHKNEW
jgi:hypothetical protein